MKKLFTLFALCTLIFSACESQQTTPTPTATKLQVIDPANSILEVLAEGGNYEIKYQLVEGEVANETRSAAPLKVSATSEAKWISNITITNSSVKFTVAANNGGAREDYMQISYGDQFAIIMIQQLGYEAPDVVFKATHLNGTYWGKYPTTKGFNYLVILGDMSCPHYLTKEEGATEYRFNIYSDVSSAFNSKHRIPVGTYRIDHSSSGRPGTIDGHKDQSYYFSAEDTDVPYVDAVMVVTENSIVVDVEFYNGEKHRVEYNGNLYYEGYTETENFGSNYPVWSEYTSDIAFDVTGGFVDVYYRGDYYGTGCDTWFISLIEEKVNGHYNGTYLLLDLIIPRSTGGVDNIESIEGEYSIFYEKPDNYEYTAPGGRFRDDNMQWHAWYMICKEGQGDISTAAPFRSGTIKVTVDRPNLTFEFDGVDDAGNKIIGTFTGSVNYWIDQSYE